MKKTSFFLLFLLLFQFSSCESEDYKHEGVIIWGGDSATDGCGWLINVNDSTYSPINLSSEFKIDSLNVLFDYQKLESRNHCGWRQPGYANIEITKIINK